MAYGCGYRSCRTAKRNNPSSRCHASVFQQHYPTRKRSPRTPKGAQVPLDVYGDNADRPDDDRQRGSRPQERQQPEQVPWIYDWCTEKRCCHRPRECVRRPCVGSFSQPDCGEEADEHCQPSQQLRRHHLIECRKQRTIKAETLHICTQRADRNAAVIQKWQQPEKIPWEYDGSAYKRCCHWPGKYVRRPFAHRAS